MKNNNNNNNNATRPDIVNKQERKCAIIVIALPGDKRISEKENDNVKSIRSLKKKLQGCGT